MASNAIFPQLLLFGMFFDGAELPWSPKDITQSKGLGKIPWQKSTKTRSNNLYPPHPSWTSRPFAESL
jgi:hypothetical protein